RPLAEEIRKPLPVKTLALAATAQPLVPRPLRRFDETQQTRNIAADAEVIAVASQTSTERGVLGLNRLMPMASTPVVDGLLGPSEACPPCLAPHPPVTCAGPPPIQREPPKGQRCPALDPAVALVAAPTRAPAASSPDAGSARSAPCVCQVPPAPTVHRPHAQSR